MKIFVGDVYKEKCGAQISVVAARSAEEAAKIQNEQGYCKTALPQDFEEIGTCRKRNPALLYEKGHAE